MLRVENERIEARVRDRIRAEDGVPTAAGIMDVLFATLADERYLRLFVWAEIHADYQGDARRNWRDSSTRWRPASAPPSWDVPFRAERASRRSC
ncbi:hypothetical protein AB0M50_28195 [Nonomuraea fuscirosea]|uniref:hypothetical protein n=1 Tax=Nonomuraea fuscirosea TaxID=1291556 RepID=UPI0034337A9B